MSDTGSPLLSPAVEQTLPAAGPTSEDTPPPPLLAAPRPATHEDRIAAEFREVRDVGLFYGLMLLPILAATAWNYHTKTDHVETDFIVAAVLYTTIAAAAVWWKPEWRSLIRVPTQYTARIVALIVATPMLTLLAARLTLVLADNLGLPTQDLTAGYGPGGYPLGLLVLLVAVLPPVFEEIAFRGILLGKLQKVMSPVQAIGVSAILFGVVHFSLLSMAIFLIPMGAIAGYLTLRTKSLLPAILIHAAHNAGVVVLRLLER